MKIMFLHSSLAAGGAERTIATLANTMAGMGHTVAIVTRRSSEDHYEIDPTVLRFRNSHTSVSRCGFLMRASNIYHRQTELVRAARKFSPDITITFGASAMLSVVLARNWASLGKLIFSERSNPYISSVGLGRRLITRFAVSLFANGVIFQTEGSRGYYSRRVQKRSAIIENPISPDFVSTGNPKPYRQRAKRLLVVGRLEPVKAVDVILRAFALFRRTHSQYSLDIVGEGSERESLERLAAELGVANSVRFLGKQSNVYHHLTNARFYVLASRHEGMPNSLMEAMAAGVACISSDCDFGPRSLVRHGVNGWLFPVGDAVKLSALLELATRDISGTEAVAHRASFIAVSNSTTRITQRYLDYFRRLIS